jgi:uncharacterized caspase-like protein
MSKRIALIIYNDTYLDPSLARFKSFPADTATLAALLREPSSGNFNLVETLINQPAAELRRRITALFHRKQRHDELLLYFVGLSLLDETGQIYLAAADTCLEALAETAISAAYLTGCMDRSFSRRQMLVLDCPYRRAAVLSGINQPDSLIFPAAAFAGKGYGRVVLTTTDTIQLSLARGLTGHESGEVGLTHYLLEALQSDEADADKDGQIELKELYEYILRQVRESASPIQPSLRLYGEQDRFIIARNPHLYVPAQPIKWDLISGAILAPTTIIVIGGGSDLRASVGLAGLFLLLYAFLYLAPD